MPRIFKLAASLVLLPFVLAADVYQIEAKRLAGLMSWKPGEVIQRDWYRAPRGLRRARLAAAIAPS